MHKILSYNKFIICFAHYVLIIRRSKLYYTASGIVTLKKLSGLKLYLNCVLVILELSSVSV